MNNTLNEGLKDCRKRRYLTVKRILWSSKVLFADELLKEGNSHASLSSGKVCTIKSGGGILLDFGIELQGGVHLIIQRCANGMNEKIRIRFGESAMEAMSDLGYKNSTNDHAIRDAVIDVSALGNTEFGSTGFRFVRIDVLGDDSYIEIKEIRAVLLYRDIEYKGSFECSDPLINEIWKTGAYTVHLNMQDYLWDGIKRDRLVWVGDMHPEVSTIQAVFGYNDCVPKSLDFIKKETMPTDWMNGIPTYSMWWIKIHRDWFYQNGDLEYLKEQAEYLYEILEHIFNVINDDGTNVIENKFVDWPSYDNKDISDAGVHAMLVISIVAAKELCYALGNRAMYSLCDEKLKVLKKYIPDCGNYKQIAALLSLAGVVDVNEINRSVLSVNPLRGMSTFLGYYTLQAIAIAGDMNGALDVIRGYWGKMLSLGATTFWEDFDIDWAEDCARIDEIVPNGKKDIHGDFGRYCYEGFRHSLCHGWASGPTAFLSKYVLGVKIIEPGCRKIKIEPDLGRLEFAYGTYPTPFGPISIEHRLIDGKIKTVINAPTEVKICKRF